MKDKKMFEKKVLIKYTRQCLEIFWDPTNMPNFYLLSLDGHYT